jgi:hypothetical protein
MDIPLNSGSVRKPKSLKKSKEHITKTYFYDIVRRGAFYI